MAKKLRTKVWDFTTLNSPESLVIDLDCWRYTLTVQPFGASGNLVNGIDLSAGIAFPYVERVGGGPVRENDVQRRLEINIVNPKFLSQLIVETYEDAEG